MDFFWSELPEFFGWLTSGQAPLAPQPYQPRETGTILWVPTRAAQLSQISGPIERIRMAAANRVCVKLMYSGELRTIEPYSFRKSADGNLLFYGFHREDRQMKCFRVDRFERVDLTDTPYVARYPVEIFADGPLRAPQNERTTPGRFSSHRGPIYVVECRMCGRKFERTKRDASIRRHKDPSGYDCRGRSGSVVDTRY